MVVSVKRAAEVLKACLDQLGKRRRVAGASKWQESSGELQTPLSGDRDGRRCCDPKKPIALPRTAGRLELEELPDDILARLFSWLSFEDVHSVILTCRDLYRLREKRGMFRVLCQQRWPHSFASAGGGPRRSDVSEPPKPKEQICGLAGNPHPGGPPHYLSGNDWYCHVLARDRIERAFRTVYDPQRQLLRATESLDLFKKSEEGSRLVMMESIRWVVELWDKFTLIHGRDWDLRHQNSIKKEYNRAVLDLLAYSVKNKDRATTLLATKVIGILCRDERNRINIGNARGVESLVSLLNSHRDDPKVVEVAIWALVHHSRPVGGIEGESYDVEEHTDYDININRMWEAGCLESCLQICEMHRDKPSVLAKVFWLIVNLSLPEERKDRVLAAPVVQYAVEALRQYPDHWELNYRAVFSLVNICCYMPVKTQFLKMRGFTHLNNVMARWPKDHVLQRTAVNVVKGFSTTQVEGAAGDSAASLEDHREMFSLVCTAMREDHVLERIEESVTLFEGTREEEFPGAGVTAELARWMHDLVAINAH